MSGGVQVAAIHLTHASGVLLAIIIFILFSALVRIALRWIDFRWLPESGVILLLGVACGGILRLVGVDDNHEVFSFNEENFFLLLIPPIIFEAAFFMDRKLFFGNIGTIVVFAVVGTVIATFVTGLLLFAVRNTLTAAFPLSVALVFGSLISAVDPVAVLAIFDEVHVNETLFMLVMGESVMNDAVAIVLYNTFSALVDASETGLEVVALALAKFIVVSLGGVAVGFISALLALLFTKFTERLTLLEPLIVYMTGYLAYLIAEMFSFSGIVSIMVCGIVLQTYVGSNISHKSSSSLGFLLRALASTTDTIVFVYLGISLVLENHKYDASLIIWTIFFITLIRFATSYSLSFLANRNRLVSIRKREMFVMSFGGIRGAVAFALALLLQEKDSIDARRHIMTATLIIILYTIFVQGGTMKPIIQWLHVRTQEKKQKQTNIFRDEVTPSVLGDVQDAARLIYGGYVGILGVRTVVKKMDRWITKYFVKGLHPEERQVIDAMRHLRRQEVKALVRTEQATDTKRAAEAIKGLIESPNVDMARVAKECGLDKVLGMEKQIRHKTIADAALAVMGRRARTIRRGTLVNLHHNLEMPTTEEERDHTSKTMRELLQAQSVWGHGGHRAFLSTTDVLKAFGRRSETTPPQSQQQLQAVLEEEMRDTAGRRVSAPSSMVSWGSGSDEESGFRRVETSELPSVGGWGEQENKEDAQVVFLPSLAIQEEEREQEQEREQEEEQEVEETRREREQEDDGRVALRREKRGTSRLLNMGSPRK